MGKYQKKFFCFTWGDPECIRAEDIPFSESESIKDRVDSALVFGTEYNYIDHDGEKNTLNKDWEDALELAVTDLPAGSYRLSWSAVGFSSIQYSVIRSIKSSGTEQEYDQIETTNDNYSGASGFKVVPLEAGNHNFKIQHKYGGNGNGVSFIRSMRLELYRVS